MPQRLSQIINQGRPVPQAPPSASIMGERLARVMGASPQEERAYQGEVADFRRAQEESVALAQREDAVRQEKRRSRLEQMQGEASAIRDTAMADYGRITGRPTAKDASGRVVTTMDDESWNRELAKKQNAVETDVAKERATARKAEHAAKVDAATLEEQRLAHAANDPALRVMPDTDRKKIEESLATQRNATLAGLMPEVERRVAARIEDSAAREAALASARMGQYDPEIVAEIERDMPEAFAAEKSLRDTLAADDATRAKRSDLEQRRHAAAGKVLETKAIDPLAPDPIPAPRDAFEAPAAQRELNKRHEDLATRAIDLSSREEAVRASYETAVAAAEATFSKAISGKVTRGQYAVLEAERDAALIRARADLERAQLDLEPDRARLRLDQKDFETVQRSLSKAAPVVPSTGNDVAARGTNQGDGTDSPAASAPVVDRGDGVREVEISADATKPAREMIAAADATARDTGAEVYLNPASLAATPDPEAPRPARIAAEEVETMRANARKAIEAQGKQLETLGAELVGQVSDGKLDPDKARSTYEAQAAEMLNSSTSESRKILDETFSNVLSGRMSIGQGRSIAEVAGIEPTQFDEMVAASVDRTAKVSKLRSDLSALYSDAAPQKDFLTTIERETAKAARQFTFQEGASGFGRLWADTLNPGLAVLNIFRDATGMLGGDKEAAQQEQVANRTADIARAIDETLAKHESAAAALIAQNPDLSDAEAEQIKLEAVRGAVARNQIGLEEVAAGVVESPESYLPFVGDLVALSVETAPVISAALKARRGEDLNETDEYFLQAYIENAGRDHNALGLAAEIVTQLPAFGTEIALTGGIGTAVKKGAAKGLGAEIRNEVIEGVTGWAAKRAQMRLLKEQGAKGLLARGAASLAGTTAQTPFAMADKIAADIITKMTIPDLEGFDGDVQEWAKGPGMGFGHAMAQAGYDAWVEMVSESAGGLLRLPSGLTNRLAKSSWVRAAAKLNPATSTSAIGKFARRAQLHGPLGEIFEERVGDAMRGAAYEFTGGYIGDEFQLPTADQWAGEAIGMLAGNGAFAAINARATAEGKRANQRLFEQNHAPVAAFGDWSNTSQVADAINAAFGRNPGEMPYTAEEIEGIEAQIGPLAEMPAVRRIVEADAKLADLMGRAEALDDLDTLGRATSARVAHTRARLAAAMQTIAAHREAGRAAASLAEMGAADQAAMITGGQKLAAGRPLAEMTAAERAAWMPQPTLLPDGSPLVAPVYVEEVNGRPIVTDAGKAALAGSLGADLTESLLPMPEAKARRLALQPERKPWTPPASPSPSSKATNGAPSPASSPSPSGAASSAAGSKTTWRARGERGTVVEIPADAATSLDDAERQLAAMLPMGEMLAPDSVEPPSVRQAAPDADEIPGVDSNQKQTGNKLEAAESEPRPLDPVRAQVAALNLPPRDAKNAESLLGVIEGLGAQDIFEAIEFTDTGAQGMEVVIDTMTLRVNLPVLAGQVRGANHLVTAAIEEIIHGAALRSLDAGKVAEMWRATPGALKKTVLQAYRYDVGGAQGDLSDVAAGHELIRMVVQDRAFRAQITEAQDLPASFGQKLLDLLRDLVSALRKHIGKLDKNLKRDLDTQVEAVIRTLEEFGVAVTRSGESPAPVRGERGISPGADQAGAGAQRITAEGATEAAPASREPRLLGSTGTAYTSTGEPIEFQWAVVEPGDVVTSHTDALTPNPVYDQTLQGRNRDSAASEASITDIEGNTVFARLSDAGDTASGAPIVGPDLLVESGNGRSIALRRAYKKRRPNVATYKADLVANAARYGLDPAAVEVLKAPMLVRVRRTEVDRVAFAEDANRPTVARLSEREVAMQDAKSLTPSVLEQLEVTADGDLYTPANQGFFRQFFRMNVSSGELPGLVDADGRLTKTGLDRIRNAVFVSAYGADPQAMRIFERLVESVDPDQRNLVNALVSAAPEMARYRAEVAAGSAYPTSFPQDLIAAAGEFLQARADGARIEEYLGQQQMFESRAPEVEALMRFFDANVRSGRRIGIGVRNVLREIERSGNPSEMGLFGDTTPPDLMPLIESGLGRSELLGSEMQGEMALAMGAPATPKRTVPKKHERYITASIERYFQRIEETPGELDEMARQLVTSALKNYAASETMNPGEAVRSVVPRYIRAANPAEQMSQADQGKLARLLSLRILKAQAINEGFKEKVRGIAAVKAGDWAPLVAPVKGLNRAFEKAVMEDWTPSNRKAAADGKEWGFYSLEAAANNVQDLVRGSIIVQDGAEMPEALEEIGKRFNVLRVKDRWNNPLPSGYADYLLTVETEIGGAEFQIHIPEMLVAKEGWFQGIPEEYRPVDPPARYGHSYYVEQRSIADHLPNAKEKRNELNALMRQLYFSALLAHSERTGSLPALLRKPITKFSQEGKRFVLMGFSSGAGTKVPLSATSITSSSVNTTGRSLSPQDPNSNPAGAEMATVPESMPEDRADRELTQENLTLAMGAPATPPVSFSYSLGIPRADMPQIRPERQMQFLQNVRRRGVPVDLTEMPVSAVKPTQIEYYPEKVEKALKHFRAGSQMKRAIVSREGFILDGHHQFVAASIEGIPLPVIRVGLPVGEAFEILLSYDDVHEGSREVVRKQVEAHGQRMASLAMGAPAFQAEQFDLFGYQAPDGGIRRIPKAKPASAETGPLSFQANLFDWQPSGGNATVSGDGNRNGRVGSGSSARATARPADRAPQSRGEVGAGGADDLFAWGGGPSRRPDADVAGQPGGDRGGQPARGDRGNTDGAILGAEQSRGGGDLLGLFDDRPVGDPGDGVSQRGESGQTGELTQPPAPEPAPTPAPRQRPTEPADRNHVIPDGSEPSPGGAKLRVEANFAALALLRQLETEGRNATPEEKAILTRYTGWGSFKEAFNKIAYADHKNSLDNIPHYYRDFASRPGVAPYLEKAKAWMDRHGALHERLVEELSPEEFDAASRSIKNAHYTSVEVVDSVWEIARKAGFRGGKALEPAGGSGIFIGRTPADLADSVDWEAVELDEVTARLLAKLYPEARVNSVRPAPDRIVSGQGFQDAKIPNNSQDLVISNVPFAKVGPGTSKREFGIAFNLHNYFFAKALAKAKPGGLVVFITTHNTMDASAEQRRWLARNAELVHAVRLPNTAFKANAGTEVVTDIIVLRKPDGSNRAPVSHDWGAIVEVGTATVEKTIATARESYKNDISKAAIGEGLADVPRGWRPADPAMLPVWQAWDEKRPGSGAKFEALVAAIQKNAIGAKNSRGYWTLRMDFVAPVEANEYFRANPALVVGRHTMTGSMYREAEYNVEPPAGGPEAYRAALRAAVDATPDVGQALASPQTTAEVRSADAGDRVGAFVERDGVIYQVTGNQNTGEAFDLTPVQWKASEIALWKSWDRLLQSTEKLIALELQRGADEADIEAARRATNRHYEQHVRDFGHLANPSRRSDKKKGLVENKNRFLETDARGYSLLQSLEEVKKDVDPVTGIPRLRYKKAPILEKRVLRPAEPPSQADSIEDALTASMGWYGRVDLGYMAGLLGQTRDQVRGALIEARYAFEDPLSGLLTLADEYLSGNVVEKLRIAQEAAATDGRYQPNVEELEKVRPARQPISTVGVSVGATWIPEGVYEAFVREVLGYPSAVVRVSPVSVSLSGVRGRGSLDFSTNDMDASEIFDALTSYKVPTVKRNVGTSREPQWVVDREASDLALNAAAQMRSAFTSWIRTTTTEVDGRVVGDIVADEYHEKVNTMRPPTYKGDWVTLPDQSGVIWLKAHRKAVLARLLSQGYGMMAHGVGSGKTFNQIALAHELKRTGRARKPVIVVMNSTIEQFAASYKQAYPQANLLVANPKGNFDRQNRALFYAQAATGDWDAIIIPHSTLKMIPNREETVRAFYQQQIAEMQAAIADAASTGERSMAQNDIQGAIDSLRERMEREIDGLKKYQDGASLFWEDLGVDALIVDEAHVFKNAPVVTAREGVKNLPTGAASDNALSMQMKVATVQERTGGKNVFFATGTPITNTMAEAYVMIRYLQPSLLTDKGIRNFDDFANLYSETVTKPEGTWKGTIANTTRLTKFVNGRSLIDLIRTVFDVALGNDKLGLDVPRVKGGGPQTIIVEPSEVAEEINDWILDIADSFESLEKKAIRENPRLGAIPIVTMQAGVAAALDPRLVAPNAPDHPGSKVNLLVERMVQVYEAGRERKTAQVVFSDLRRPMDTNLLTELVGYLPFSERLGGGKGDFDLFEDIKTKLVARGVPASEIWWPGESDKPEFLAEQYDKINSGEIRFVFGSTARIGTGVNFQERLAAAHHLGPPRDIKPAMMEQRNGRIIRQGNLHAEWAHNAFVAAVEKAAGRRFEGDEPIDRRQAAQAWLDESGTDEARAAAEAAASVFDVEINYFALKKSMDSAIFAMMSAKQGMIAQSLSDANTEDEFADPADEIQFAMAETAANALGDADMIRMVELERQVKEARAEGARFAQGVGARMEIVRNADRTVAKLQSAKDWVDSLGGAHRIFEGDTPPVWKIGDQIVDPDNRAKDAPRLLETLESWLALRAMQRGASNVLEVGGLKFRVTDNPVAKGTGYIEIEGGNGHVDAQSFAAARGLVSKIRKIVDRITEIADQSDRLIQRERTGAERAATELAEMGREWPGAEGLRMMERELVDTRARVMAKTEEAREERRARAEERARLRAGSAAAGVIAEPEVAEVALAMGTRPHLDLTADWSTWPLAETVMDIAGVPAKIRPLMRKTPRIAPLVKFAGGARALETALGNAGIAISPGAAPAAENTPSVSLPIGSPARGTTPATWDNDEAAIRDTLDYFARRLPSPAAMDERRREIGARTSKADPEGAPLNLDGTPDRIDIRREIAAVRDVQLDRMRSQTHEQWVAEAKRLIEEDYEGVVRALLEHAREGEPLPNPALVKAAQIIIPRLWRHAKATGDKAEIRDAQALTYAYLEGGTRASYVLGARRDMFKTQAERHVDFLSGIIARVPPAVRKRAEAAPTPSGKRRRIAELESQIAAAKKTATTTSAELAEARARIEKAKGAGKAGLAEIERLNQEIARAKGDLQRLGKELVETRKAKDRAEILGEAHEARLAKVEAVLRDMGLTLHDIFSHQAVVRLRGSEIVARVIEENFSAPQRAAIRFSLPPEGQRPREVAKRTGIARDAIPGLMQQFRQKMEARFLELAKNGLTLNDFMAAEAGGTMFDVTARIGERGESLGLGQSRVSDAEAAAAAKEMMEALMGGGVTVEDRRGGRRKPNQVPFDIENRTHVTQVGNVLKSAIDAGAYDMAYEYWINNILSGPQTHTVNIAGNALNMALEYGLQRWMEATWNLVVGDPKGATFGEYGHIFRSLGQVWGISVTKAVEAWATEESFLSQDLLRDPARVGGLEKSTGFNSEGYRAIPDRLGKVGTVGAKDLPSALIDVANGKGWKGASVGKTVRIPGRALLFMDTLFKGVVARAEVAGQAYRRGRANGLQGAALESYMRGEVNTPGSESWHAALQKGEELTFTNELKGASEGGGLFEQLVKKLQESRTADNTLSPLAAALVGWFFPFIQTPFNIYKAGLRRTPFGLLGIGAHLLRSGIVSWREGEPFIKNYGQARLVRDLTDQTISSLITFLLLGIVEGDDDDDTKPILLTGSRPYGVDSKGERELVDRLEGGAMTLRVGTGPDAVRFDYSRLEPFATILGSVADTLRSIKRMENGAAKVDELAKFHQYALSQATDKTFLQGIVKISEIMEPGRSTASNVGRTAAQAIVPNLIRQPLRLLDDYVRDSRTAPWYYHAVPLGGFAEPRADLYGQPMKKGGTPAAGILGPVDRLARIPVDTGLAAAPVPHVADLAIRNWNRMHPDKGEQYFPTGNSITSFKDLLGEKQKLTGPQLAEVERLGGIRLRVELARAITPAEAANPTEATIEKIRAARARVFSAARDEVVRRPAPVKKPTRSLRDLMGWTPPQ